MRVEHETDEPQREALNFELKFDGLSPEYVDALLNLKKIAESILFHWKTFPIVLPQPVAVTHEGGDSFKRKTINFKDVFIAPSLEEVEAALMDTKGESRMLTKKQHKSIRDWGEFEVDNPNFPTHTHTWRLSQFLQKGSCRAHKSFLNDVTFAVWIILVVGWNRVVSPHFFSLYRSLLAIQQGLHQLADSFIGLPALVSDNLSSKLKEERSKYLVAELVVEPLLEEELDILCLFVKQQIHKQKKEKYRLDLESIPSVPYLYQTPQGTRVDLRLFSRDLIKKALLALESILEKEAKTGWFQHFKEKILLDLKSKKLSSAEIKREAESMVMDEYLRRTYSGILNDPVIGDLGTGIGQLLIEQAHCATLMLRAFEHAEYQWLSQKQQLKQSLIAAHPILSRMDTWMEKKLYSAELKFRAENCWLAHEEALQAFKDSHLYQAAYFLHRDFVFMREREPVLLKELSRVKVPKRRFHWRSPIWFPKNWIVRRVHCGESKVVPTVLSESGVSLTASSSHANPNEPVFLVDKQVTYTTTTCWPFWRWNNFVHRLWSWLWNAMFIFGVVIPWYSPFALQALVSKNPFMPDLEPCPQTGTLVPRRSSVVHTLYSRLVSLWRHISKSRTEFEGRPDRGFIGKGFTRHVNRLWNYVIKGALGTLVLVIGLPTTCAIVCCCSLCAALTAFLWIPLAVVVFHLFCTFIYDFDAADIGRFRWCVFLEAVFWNIVLQGCLQPLFAFAIFAVVCPIVAFFVMFFAPIRYAARQMWDSLMFHIVIKKRGRVPTTEGLFVRRVNKGGAVEMVYYQIIPEQALAAFEAKMELDELTAYHEEMERHIQKPQQVFSEFVRVCFEPFSASLARDGVYQQLEREAEELRSILKEKVDRRKQELNPCLNREVQLTTRMTPSDLKITLKVATTLLETFYPGHVIARLSVPEEEFWKSQKLVFRDWPGLASQMFAEIFSHSFMTPLQDMDIKFRLGIRNVNLSHFTQMVIATECQSDVDGRGRTRVPEDNIRIHPPYQLNVRIFDPMHRRESHDQEKKQKPRSPQKWCPQLSCSPVPRPPIKPKMTIPLPLPHPVQIAMVAYNREADEPLPLESDGCRHVLKTIEEFVRPAAITEFVDVSLTPAESLNSVPEARAQCPAACRRRSSPTDDSVETPTSTRGSPAMNLASAEDITVELDVDRVFYSHNSYGTVV